MCLDFFCPCHFYERHTTRFSLSSSFNPFGMSITWNSRSQTIFVFSSLKINQFMGLYVYFSEKNKQRMEEKKKERNLEKKFHCNWVKWFLHKIWWNCQVKKLKILRIPNNNEKFHYSKRLPSIFDLVYVWIETESSFQTTVKAFIH